MIRSYFCDHRARSSDFEPDDTWTQVAELARGCAREGQPVLCLMEEQPACCACANTNELMPYRVRLRNVMVVGLFCSSCVAKLNLNPSTQGTIRGRVLRTLKTNIEEDTALEQAFLFEHGPRIRMVRGRNLQMEMLS
jgi:hypothetical protein